MTYSLEAAAELLYRITGITELPANCDGLAACLNAAVAESTERAAALERVATGEVRHLHSGLCPGNVEGFDARDPDCPACQVLLGVAGPSLRRTLSGNPERTEKRGLT